MTESKQLTHPAAPLATLGGKPAQQTVRRKIIIHSVMLLFIVWFLLPSPSAICAEREQDVTASNNDYGSFPDVESVLQGQVFKSKFDREVFFLRRIRESYPAYWPALLEANLSLNDYVTTPGKLHTFIERLGAATTGTDDLAASTNLAVVTSDPSFYANTNGYHPEVLRAAVTALIGIGPIGRRVLAESFSETHYRTDATTLELFAETVGKSGVRDPKLNEALAATAFALTATNGGFYPRCTRAATRGLLLLPDGTSVVRAHLNTKELFKDPGRFIEVINGILAPRAVELVPNLLELRDAVTTKMKTLASYPGPYRDDLSELQLGICAAIQQLQAVSREESAAK